LLRRVVDTATITTAVIVFHGNRSNVSDQHDIMETLASHGVSSFVFDYSGFGASTGRPSVRNLRQDAKAAYAMFVDSVGPTSLKFAIGTSLGAAVLLDVIPDIQGSLDGVVLVGTFASSRAVGIRQGRIPRMLAFVTPELYHNVRAAARLEKPLLVIHSDADELFPVDDAKRITDAAGGPSRLEVVPGLAHDAYLTKAAHWEPVLEFLRGG
jgi:alpha-beta hydrolase superfamily lysophospholipase